MWRTIGHEWAIALLQRAIDTGRVSHAYLFAGPANVGKTHLAKEMAAALNCTGDAPPCGSCRACLKTARGTHPDVFLVEPGNGSIKIDQIRQLQRQLALSPYEGRQRIAIIADFQAATVQAANALLKTLEEPPSRVVLLLAAVDASLLLPTIVSRCQVLPLRGLSCQQIERTLIGRWHERPDLARLLSKVSGGRIGWAISATQDPSILARRQRSINELQNLLREGRAARMQGAERLSRRGDVATVIRLWQTWWRDMMLICSGCEELVVNIDRLDALRGQASQYGLASAKTATRGTEAALLQMEQNVNTRLLLEVLLLSWKRTRPI